MGTEVPIGCLVNKVSPTPERLFKQRRLRRLRKQRSREQLAQLYLRLHLLFVFFDLRSLPTERYETYLLPRRFRIGPIREYTAAAADYRVHNARRSNPYRSAVLTRPMYSLVDPGRFELPCWILFFFLLYAVKTSDSSQHA